MQKGVVWVKEKRKKNALEPFVSGLRALGLWG